VIRLDLINQGGALYALRALLQAPGKEIVIFRVSSEAAYQLVSKIFRGPQHGSKPAGAAAHSIRLET
jgi:hypothetical protein|tara:strand:+ start:142 stop:342 length:201 start_codon:yes stop_codon:yes gene_type:complete